MPPLNGENWSSASSRTVRLPSVLARGLHGLLQGRALHLADPFKRRNALARDRLELRPQLGRILGDELGPIARPAVHTIRPHTERVQASTAEIARLRPIVVNVVLYDRLAKQWGRVHDAFPPTDGARRQ